MAADRQTTGRFVGPSARRVLAPRLDKFWLPGWPGGAGELSSVSRSWPGKPFLVKSLRAGPRTAARGPEPACSGPSVALKSGQLNAVESSPAPASVAGRWGCSHRLDGSNPRGSRWRDMWSSTSNASPRPRRGAGFSLIELLLVLALMAVLLGLGIPAMM